MHIDQFVRFKGLLIETDYVPTEYSDSATNCPEYKVTAVQVAPASHRSKWQDGFEARVKRQGHIVRLPDHRWSRPA